MQSTPGPGSGKNLWIIISAFLAVGLIVIAIQLVQIQSHMAQMKAQMEGLQRLLGKKVFLEVSSAPRSSGASDAIPMTAARREGLEAVVSQSESFLKRLDEDRPKSSDIGVDGGDKSPVKNPPVNGFVDGFKVIDVDAEEEFYIVNGGRDQGLKEGNNARVFRNGREIGTVRFFIVDKENAVVKVVKMKSNGAPRVGDIVQK